MDLPVLLAVHDDPGTLAAIERELDERYGRHYRVLCVPSAERATECLDELAASDVDVALALAAQGFGDTYASERARAAERGWPTAALAGRHLHQLVDPTAVGGAILGLLGRMGLVEP